MDPLRNADVMGRRGRWRRRVTQADFDRFAAVSGDDNPIHVDAAFAATTRWGRTLAHGMMLYSVVVHLIRSELLPGSVELEQDLVFPGPVFAGDELVIDAEVVNVDRELGRVEVRTRVMRGGDGVGCEGRTLVSADV
jgi:3-hydroxybutyryl-CoA dehydratase